MKARTILTLAACAAMVVLVFVRSAAAEPPPDPRLDKIFADWQTRRERIKTVRYRASGEHTWPKGTFTDPYTGASLGLDAPPHDISWPKSIVLLLDFTTSRHRLEVDEQPYSQPQGKFIPEHVTTVFDSKELWTLSLRPAGVPAELNNPDVDVVSGNMRALAFTSEYWPFFLGHGVVGLTTQQHILPGRLGVAPKKDVYHVEGEGNYADRACVVLRTEAQEAGTVIWDELWVDPGRESAVLRQAAYANDKMVMDIQIAYQETRGGWLPQSWTISHSSGGQIFSLERMHIDELEIDPPVSDTDFRVDIKPGMIVQRVTYPGSPDQIISPDPNPRRPEFRVDQNGVWKAVNGPEPRSLWLIYLGVGVPTLVLAAGVTCVIWWRRRKRLSAE